MGGWYENWSQGKNGRAWNSNTVKKLMVQQNANHLLHSNFALINGKTWASVVLRIGRFRPADVLNLYRHKYSYGITLLMAASKVVLKRGQKTRFYLPRCRVGKRTCLRKRMTTLMVWVMVRCIFDWTSDRNWVSERVTDFPWDSYFHCHVYNGDSTVSYFELDKSISYSIELILSKMIPFCTRNSLFWARWFHFIHLTAHFGIDDFILYT
jgi:hypothetical protein